MVDERALRKLATTAQHQRAQAELLTAALPRLEAKLQKARDHFEATETALLEARDAAEEAQERAETARAAYREAADGVGATVLAPTAQGSAEAN